MNRLYKYRSYNNKSLDELRNQQIWFSHGEYLNDPFDFHKIIKELNNKYSFHDIKELHKANLIGGKTLESVLISMGGDIGVLSLSKCWNSKLLWSRYGNSDRGFCIEFEFTDPIQGENTIVTNSIMKSSTSSIEALEVSYFDDFKIPTIKNLEASKGDFFRRIFVAKSIEWKSEGEFRILRQLGTKFRVQNQVQLISKLVSDKTDEKSKIINENCWKLHELMNKPLQSIKREEIIQIAAQIDKETNDEEIIKYSKEISNSARGRLYEFPSKIKSIIFGLLTPKEHKKEIKKIVIEMQLEIKFREVFENSNNELEIRELQ
ncbi:MAG: DUF2971 domain-containing protein [Cellulophaga sp.]